MRRSARDDDTASIAVAIGLMGRAFHAADLDGVLARFRADAVCVGVTGRLLLGRDNLASAASDYLSTVSDESTLGFEIVNTSFVRDDVAVVMVQHDPITRDGEILEGEPVGESMFVMSHERDGWKIAAWQLSVIRPR